MVPNIQIESSATPLLTVDEVENNNNNNKISVICITIIM